MRVTSGMTAQVSKQTIVMEKTAARAGTGQACVHRPMVSPSNKLVG